MYTREYYPAIKQNEVLTDIYYDMDESPKHDAKWKKPNKKGHMLFDAIYLKYPEQKHP